MRMKGQIRKWLAGVLSLAVCAGVFAGCSALEGVYFPQGLAFIGEEQFADGCTSLVEIRISPEARPRIYSITGNLSQNIQVNYYSED